MGYNFKQIVKAYKKIGIKRGDNVLVKSDLRYLGNFYDKKIKSNLAEAHFLALSKIINLDKGTITVSTASESICNTKIPFDINKTKSERGSFSELIRGKRSSVRSFHPFNSHTSIGNKAEFICKRNKNASTILIGAKINFNNLIAFFMALIIFRTCFKIFLTLDRLR